jgi:hypothetical protein
MTSWAAFATEAPELARKARDRFTHHKHLLLATLRSDGSPRISGIELWFWRDDAWFGMMPSSTKGADLDRDPRFELHSAPTDLDLQQPDARIRGRAVRIEDEPTIGAFAATLPDPAPPPHEMALYRIELAGAVLIGVEGDELVIETWRPGSPSRRQSRR